jgi:hypothetical protein
MRFFFIHGRKVRLGIIKGHLCVQAREAGRLGRAIPLFPVPAGTTLDECVAQINAFKGEAALYTGVFFGRHAEISFLEGDEVDFFSVLAEIA